MENQQELVVYKRVSTRGQQDSGHGLADQDSKVTHYAAYTHAKIVKTFTETESGKVKSMDRPHLKAAIALAKARRCPLVISKLDRVGRVAADILNLLNDPKLTVIFADSPTASRLENGVRAIFAEEEGRAISERTKNALREAKKRGVKLGNPNGTKVLKRHIKEHGNVAGVEGGKRSADAFANETRLFIDPLTQQGLNPSQIADALNEGGIVSRLGGSWHETSVRRMLDRIKKLAR